MEKFGVLEMKKILKGFLEHEKLFSFVSILKNTLDEIVDLSNGDLRKALYLIYWKGI
jgi:DNA polymerase III delta prime subunit